MVLTLLFVVLIQTAVMGSVAFVRYQMQTGTAFVTVLSRNHGGVDGQLVSRSTRELPAPEGWDHRCFMTEVAELATDGSVSCSWRVRVRNQPVRVVADPLLAAERTGIVILVDDSESMTWACGGRFEDEAIYLKRPAGEIVRTIVDAGPGDFWETESGTYFFGRYGNAWIETPFAGFMGGALPIWTELYPALERLVAGLDACDVALLTTSGQAGGFMRDLQAIQTELAAIHPGSDSSDLAERLYQATDLLDEPCFVNRHIVIFTDGRAMADGDLPGWLRDYDHDDDPLDVPVSGEGCRCLDDVAAYAADKAIQVHLIGPDNAFLRAVATAGQGVFMPEPGDIVPPDSFNCLPPLDTPGGECRMTNRSGRFDPAWLNRASAVWLDDSLNPVDAFSWHGPATGCCLTGSGFYVSSATNLLKIDAATHELHWCVDGVGGGLIEHGGVVVAGPDRDGLVTALDAVPVRLWQAGGSLVTAGQGLVYVARADEILALDCRSGNVCGRLSFGEPVTALAYDPDPGRLLIGTAGGLAAIVTPELTVVATLIALDDDAVVDIRGVTIRKKPLYMVLGRHSVTGMREGIKLWQFNAEDLAITTGVVMDGRLYLTAWRSGEGCPGMDGGESSLIVLAATDGSEIARERLFEGECLAPVIDLGAPAACFYNCRAARRNADLSGLAGIVPVALGRRITR